MQFAERSESLKYASGLGNEVDYNEEDGYRATPSLPYVYCSVPLPEIKVTLLPLAGDWIDLWSTGGEAIRPQVSHLFQPPNPNESTMPHILCPHPCLPS